MTPDANHVTPAYPFGYGLSYTGFRYSELKGFTKLSLAPHQHRTATISLTARSFSSWDTAAQAWQVAPGCDTIMVGSSSRSLPLRARVPQGGASCRSSLVP